MDYNSQRSIIFSGEDNKYPNRVFVMYDGIHYDPMGLEENGKIIQTVFPTDQAQYQAQALEVANELKKVSYYLLKYWYN